MTKLLSANFLRLRKSHLFWGTLVFSALLAAFRVTTLWRDHVDVGVVSTLDEALFTYAQIIGLTAAVFTSLFLGTEYSDGAIRSKIVSGCSRLSIYLAGFLTTFAAAVLNLAAYWIVALAEGVLLLEPSQMGVGKILFSVFGILLMAAAFCAIFTFIAMNCGSKATTAVMCILLFFAMLVASTYIFARLDAPEEQLTYSMTDGEMVSYMQPNPRYLRGTERTVYEFFRDLLPTGQGVQYSIGTVTNPLRLLLCSLGLFAVFTGAGATLFRRKDLK